MNNYFLGSIVVKENKKADTDYILIDGQQRITTLFLMCSALYDLLKSLGKEKIKWGGKLYQILKPHKDKFKLQQTEKQEIIQKIMEGEYYNLQNDEKKNNNYSKVYKRFEKYFEDIYKKEKNLKKLKIFYKGISKIQVALIELDYKDDEHLIFESINSKGLILSSVDLIKNYIFLSLYENNLEKLEKIFKENFLEQIPDEKDLGKLYRQILAIKKGILHTLNTKDLYYGFKKSFSKEKINESFINSRRYDLEIFKYIRNNKNWENKNLPLFKAQLWNFYSIIHLTIRKNSSFKNKELKILDKKNIKYVVNFLSRLVVARMLCGFGKNKGNRTYAKLCKDLNEELDKNNFKDVFRKIIKEKLEQTSRGYRMPTWDDVKSQAFKNDIYSSQSILKWILIALEQNVIKPVILSNPEKISVEHIYPQNSSKWEDQLSENEKLKMNSMLHTLGNLSITYQNAKLSNKTFDEKKKILKKTSNFRINEILYKENKWDSDATEKRCKKLLKDIYDLWWN